MISHLLKMSKWNIDREGRRSNAVQFGSLRQSESEFFFVVFSPDLLAKCIVEIILTIYKITGKAKEGRKETIRSDRDRIRRWSQIIFHKMNITILETNYQRVNYKHVNDLLEFRDSSIEYILEGGADFYRRPRASPKRGTKTMYKQ